SYDDSKTMRREFMQYRSQLPPFDPIRPCWDEIDDPKLFWLLMESHTKLIGRIACRIFATPTNSVASERSFSVQNVIKDKPRNSLQPKKVDKMVYIYMNKRVIRGMENGSIRKGKSYRELTDKEEVELEETILEVDTDAADSDNAQSQGVEVRLDKDAG